MTTNRRTRPTGPGSRVKGSGKAFDDANGTPTVEPAVVWTAERIHATLRRYERSLPALVARVEALPPNPARDRLLAHLDELAAVLREP